MTAVTTRRYSKADDAAEVEQLRAEIAGLRQALRAVAGLAFGIGLRHQPVNTNGGGGTIADICRIYGISGQADVIKELFG